MWKGGSVREADRVRTTLLLASVLVACGSRTDVERLAPDVLYVTGPDTVVRLGDASHPSVRYELSTVVDPAAPGLLHDLVLNLFANTDDWMDAELEGFGEIDGRTVDVLPEEPVACDTHDEDDLLLALFKALFPTPECRARYVVVLPDGILTVWPDGFTLFVGASSGRTWQIPVTGAQISEHLDAVARMRSREATTPASD